VVLNWRCSREQQLVVEGQQPRPALGTQCWTAWQTFQHHGASPLLECTQHSQHSTTYLQGLVVLVLAGRLVLVLAVEVLAARPVHHPHLHLAVAFGRVRMQQQCIEGSPIPVVVVAPRVDRPRAEVGPPANTDRTGQAHGTTRATRTS
jgi:hypothetical protein